MTSGEGNTDADMDRLGGSARVAATRTRRRLTLGWAAAAPVAAACTGPPLAPAGPAPAPPAPAPGPSAPTPAAPTPAPGPARSGAGASIPPASTRASPAARVAV